MVRRIKKKPSYLTHMPLWISEQLNESACMKILLANPVVAGRLRAVVQLGNAGFIQLREQHHGPHNEPVRSSVITSFDAGSASVAFSPGIQSLLICSAHCRYRRWTTTSRRREVAASQAPEEPHHQHRPMAWAVVRLLEVRFHESATKLYYSAKLFSWEGWLP